MSEPRIRVGVGGWNFEPWRGTFYPDGLSQKKELAYASSRLSAIEINSTYYGSQKAETFARWRDETPDDFVFSVKASRFATNRRVLADAADSVERFIGSGIAELGPKLGPIVWQFAPSKVFEPGDFEAFLKLLPTSLAGRPLRHALDVRHPSFMDADFLALARRHRCATVFTESDDYPSFADQTADFVYTRVMRSSGGEALGLPAATLDALADCARVWQQGSEPADVPRVEPAGPTVAPRDVFIYFISGAKEKNPAAAMALLERLKAAESRT